MKAKDKAQQIEPQWGDEFVVSRRFGLSIQFLRKDRGRARPIIPFAKLKGAGPKGGFVRYHLPTLDRLMASSQTPAVEEAEAAS